MTKETQTITGLQARVKELEEKLKVYEEDPTANFYYKLVQAIDHIGLELENKTLDFDNDSFASSVLTLSDKSTKIFDGLKAGRESFLASKKVDEKQQKRIEKGAGRVAM